MNCCLHQTLLQSPRDSTVPRSQYDIFEGPQSLELLCRNETLSDDEKKKLSNRLRRVIGQVEAIVVGLVAWFFLKPMDRDETAFGVALGLGIATVFFGGMLSDFIFGIRVHSEICFAGEDKHNQLSPGSGVAGHW